MSRVKVLQFGLMTALLASGYGVMFTVLDEFRDEYGIEAQWLGLIVGIGFLSAFVSQVFLAPVADRGHARKLVLAGLVLNVIGLLGMAAGTTLVVLLIARLVSGIGVGMAVPAVRRIVINGDPDNLGNNLGLLLSSDVAGFAAGPAVSAVLVPSLGIPAPFLVIALATALCIPLVMRVDVAEATGEPGPRFAFDLLRRRSLVAALMMGSAVFLMIGTFDALWAIVLDDLRASDWVANVGISIFAMPLVFLGSYGGRLAQRVGPFRLGPLGLILGAGFMFSYGVLPTGMAMFCVGVFHAISDGLTVSSTGVAVGVVVQADRQAGAQGMLGAAETLTGGATAVLAGVLYSTGGRTLAYTVCAVVMVALSIGAAVLAGPAARAKRLPVEITAPTPVPAAVGRS
ncbi:MAG: MFS transporter [Ilumatobacteraceae bacterium]